MLYWLIQFSDKIPLLDVFRYIVFRTGGAVATALLVVFLFGPTIIGRLRIEPGVGRPIRSEAPSRVGPMIGAPREGGLMILSGALVSTLPWANPLNRNVCIMLGVVLAIIGGLFVLEAAQG
jgi:phospho-N-acetylmuramoyl-pentapeptide-transferase